MVDWRVDFFEARWHLDVAKRMLNNYEEFPEKGMLVGAIKEGARAAGKLVRALLIFDKTRGDLGIFIKRVAPKYLDVGSVENLVRMLEVERAQRVSRVEFAKGSDIILLIDGKWKILKISRIREFVKSINDIINNFPTSIKR